MKVLKITNLMRLKMAKKVARETSHAVKPMVTVDRKKKANRRACRDYRSNLES